MSKHNLSQPVIRNFGMADYDAVIALWNEASLPYKPRGRDRREKIAIEMTRSTAIFLVAEIDVEIVGCVFGTHDGRKGWINRLAVSPGHRKCGIAAMLVAEVEERLQRLGIEIVACLIEVWNPESMAVFEKLGYRRHDDIVYFTKRKSSET